MTYARFVPGMTYVRGSGIIDSRRFLLAPNGARLIESSDSWSNDDKKSLIKWREAFLYWMENSTGGQKLLP